MDIRTLADIAIDEDPRAPCLWIPSEAWSGFCDAVGQRPNLIGVVIYRNKTVRDGGPNTDIVTGSEQGRRS